MVNAITFRGAECWHNQYAAIPNADQSWQDNAAYPRVSIAETDAGDFLISFNSCPPDLVANAACTVSLEFQPTAIGTRTAALAFSDNGGASPQLVKLTEQASKLLRTAASITGLP